MANFKKFFSRIHLVYRPSQTATKVMVVLALVLCTGALVTLRLSTNALKAENEALFAQAAELSAENDALREDIAQLGSVESALEIAREELGLAQPDVIIFEPES